MSLLSYYSHLKHFNKSKESVFFFKKKMSLAEEWIDQSINLYKKGEEEKDLKKGSITNKGRVFHEKGFMNPLLTQFYVRVCNNCKSVLELQQIVGNQSFIC